VARRAGITGLVNRSLPVLTPGCRFVTFRKPPRTPIRAPPCVTIAPGHPWTGTPPTSCPPISLAPPDSVRQAVCPARCSPAGHGPVIVSRSRPAAAHWNRDR
jgi:hypothetical protein